jgi:hypothetical protein
MEFTRGEFLKTFIHLSLLAAAFAAASQATTIQLASSAANTTNNSGNPTVNIIKNPAWADPLAGSSWVSTGSTGDPSAPGYVVFPNGTNILFSQTFLLDGIIDSASLSVMADDTAAVFVNGTKIFAESTGPSNISCAATPIGCLVSTTKTFSTADLKPYLATGAVNTISFQVFQVDKSSFGLDYAGQIVTHSGINPQTPTPEPGTLGLLGVALGGLVFGRKHMAKTRRV